MIGAVTGQPWRGIAVKPATASGTRILPLDYWLRRFPPGWISRYAAAAAEPLEIARDIQAKLALFEAWLAGPEELRCDTYALQSLSAALFNRYLDGSGGFQQLVATADEDVRQLSWPPGSEVVQACLHDLRRWLAGPFAVYKALRTATNAGDTPNQEELRLAEATLVARRDELRMVMIRLGFELDCCRLLNLLPARPRRRLSQSIQATIVSPQPSLAK